MGCRVSSAVSGVRDVRISCAGLRVGGTCRAVDGREAVCDERQRRGAHIRQCPDLACIRLCSSLGLIAKLDSHRKGVIGREQKNTKKTPE